MNELTIAEVQSQAPAAFTATKASHLSDRYKPIQTIKLVEPLLEEGWKITRVSQAQYRRPCAGPHGYHIIGLSRSELKFNEGQVEALIFNSHNGTKRFEIRLGVWRMVCSNGLIDASTSFDEVSAKHFYSLEVMQERGAQIIARAPKIIAKIDEWKNRILSLEEITEFERYAFVSRFPKKTGQHLVERFNSVRRPEDHGSDLWHTFNRLQEDCIKGGVMVNGRASRAVRSIHRNVKLNEVLWEGAEKIASGTPLFSLS